MSDDRREPTHTEHTERVVIQLPDVYREVQRLALNFERFIATYDERETHRSDHEARLQKLERYKAALPLSLLTSLGAALLALSR